MTKRKLMNPTTNDNMLETGMVNVNLQGMLRLKNDRGEIMNDEKHEAREDKELKRWSGILLFLGYATAVMSILGPLSLLSKDAPIILARGKEVWSTTFSQIGGVDGAVVLILALLPTAAWVYAVFYIVQLARHYQAGRVFAVGNTGCFLRIGAALAAMGVLDMAVYPLSNLWLFYRGITPWLGDMPILALFDPSLIMAGAFFYVLGKIMARGVALEDNDRLTV